MVTKFQLQAIKIQTKDMKVKDIKNKKFSVLLSANGYEKSTDGSTIYRQVDLSLQTILFVLSKNYAKHINNLRAMTYHSNEQKEYKSHFPVWFVGGTFPFKKTHDADITSYSNILAIDIDACDNPSMSLEMIREELMKLPYVFAVLKSISGLGIYALVLVEDGKHTKGYYKYLVNLWHNKFGVKIDESCSNIGRKRFISYEDNIEAYIKSDETEIIPWKLEWIEPTKEEPVHPILFQQTEWKTNESLMTERTHLAMQKLIDNGYAVQNYGHWYYTGCDLANFSDGYTMFVRMSHNGKWNDDIKVINKKWNDCKPSGITDDLHTKWQGMAKRQFGCNWWK